MLEIPLVFGYQSRQQGTLDSASADGPAAIPGALPRVWCMCVSGVNALRSLVVLNPEKGVARWKSWPGGRRRVESDGISGKATN